MVAMALIDLDTTYLPDDLTLAMLWLVNLYNFMDGIDGIAAIQCLLACCAAALEAVGWPVRRPSMALYLWLELPPEHADRLVIRMDPGSAFGTGSHPTTRLCLEAIEVLAEQTSDGGPTGLAGQRVADLGCGSGILGIGANRAQ